MDPYLLLKLAHVLSATLWTGGVGALTLLVLITDLRRDDAATLRALALLGLAGRHVFARASHSTLGTGLVLVWLGGWGLAPWAVLSVLLAVGLVAYPKAVLAAGAARIIALKVKGDLAGAGTLARRQLRRVGAHLCGQLAVIALMILKPDWDDPLLLAPAAILLLGAALHLRASVAGPVPQPA